MAQAKQGDTVRVHYTGKLDDGNVFDSSANREPLEFKLGEGQVIPGFEKAIEGMQPEETKEVVLPPEDAYGPRQEERMVQVGRDQIPPDLELEVGMTLEMQTPEGQKLPVVVRDVADERVTLDANHPLAGRELTFEVELVEVR